MRSVLNPKGNPMGRMSRYFFPFPLSPRSYIMYIYTGAEMSICLSMNIASKSNAIPSDSLASRRRSDPTNYLSAFTLFICGIVVVDYNTTVLFGERKTFTLPQETLFTLAKIVCNIVFEN